MDIRYYEVLENSDKTEGRGHMKVVSNFLNLEDAVIDAQGRGTMGVGSGDVVQVSITVNNDDTVSIERTKIYGYRYNKDTRVWSCGFMDFRDLPDPLKDPEYAEFLRLRKKFGDKN